MQEKLNKQREETDKAKDTNQEFHTKLMPPPPNRLPTHLHNYTNGMHPSPNDLMEMAA